MIASAVGMSKLAAGAPPERYNEEIVRAFIVATMFWGIAAFTVGVYIALELAFPALNLGLEWTSFGRLRPLHTSAAIFAFGGNALLGTSLYVVQRTAHRCSAARCWHGSCSGATSCSSSWQRRATSWGSPRAANTPSPNGMSTTG